MWKMNIRDYIKLFSLSKTTNIAMGNGAFAFVTMKIESLYVARKSLDGVYGIVFW